MSRRRKEPFSIVSAINELRSDFRAGQDSRFQSRLRGVSSTGSGADYHFRTERQQLHMMERARHYQRNDPIVGQAVRRLVANIVQDGFRLDTQTGDDGLDRELKLRWKDWCEDPELCHSEGELTFSAMERLALQHVIVDGDIVTLPLQEGSLQWVEAHRLRTPRNTRRNVVYGVQVDAMKRRVAYWITKEDLATTEMVNRVSDVQIYAARDEDGQRQVIHLYNPDRFSQCRGITVLAPVSETIGIHDDIQFATLVKCQMAALIAILRERDVNWEPLGDAQKGPQTTETTAGYTRQIEGVSAGLEIAGDPGEKLSAFAGNVPSPEFITHANLILTFIAINLDIPVHVLLLDPSNTNFSGWRGAIDQARLRFKQLQQWLVGAFHCPVYRWKVRQWMALDPVIQKLTAKSGINPFGHRWNPPQFPYIEPLTDASADLLQTRNALNSPRRIQAARGREWDEVSVEIIEDNAFAIRRALKEAAAINNEYPDAGVHWRELVSLPTPDGINIAIPAAPSQSRGPESGEGQKARVTHDAT
jgi:lambda family phage portal protein